MSRAPDPAPRGRCLAVWAATTGAAVALAELALPGLRTVGAALAAGRAADLRFDELLLGCCSLAALACAAWLWLLTTLVAAGAARGADGTPVRGVPAPLRRVLLAACGAAIAGGVTGPAVAVPTQVHEDGTTGAAVVTGLPLPERAAATTSARPARGAQGARADRTVAVRAGDSLWSLAEADLSPGAGDARITARWRQIYLRNRAVIGSDPDLIRPHQQLRLPRR